MDDISIYLSGTLLYGDDFSDGEIEDWYADEKDGYANLGAKDSGTYKYGYHALNTYHGFRYLDADKFPHVMGFGSAYGDELLPIISKIQQITIVDPSDFFVRESVQGVPARYIKPTPNGALPLENDSFDLITCLGVLHHIPNVSVVVKELVRTLRPGGYIVLREPIVSMGDWRKPRRGLTKRERGIPIRLLRTICSDSGLVVIRESLCDFPLTSRMFRMLRMDMYSSRIGTRLDGLLSALFAWNVNYHARNLWQRLRPASAFLVLRKPPPRTGLLKGEM